MGEAIVITSGKGGVGKTTSTANIGTALALMNKKVCLIDTDIGLRNLDVVMGLENRIIYDIVDVVNDRCQTEQALIHDKRFEALSVMPASQTTDKSAVTKEGMIKIVNDLRESYDYILIDCPAGIEQGFENAVAAADKAVVVTTPEKASVRDADRIVGLLEEKDHIERPQLLVNRIRNHMLEDGNMMPIDDIQQQLSIELLGLVPDSDDVIAASNEGDPIALDSESKVATAYHNIGKRILGEHVPLLDLREDSSFFGKIKSIFIK